MDVIRELHQLGQSLWYDNIQRKLINNGELTKMIEQGEIYGVTSNPSIFQKAIATSHDYDEALKPMAWAGWQNEEIFMQLAIEDIRAVADLFKSLYLNSQGADGYVSLEVNPLLAYDTKKTVAEAKVLWERVNRPNLMIKIPATLEGIPAISEVISCGINVNVTLIFSTERYIQVMDAYIKGLEKRLEKGFPVNSIASVASFFVSRIDTAVDNKLDAIVCAGGSGTQNAKHLLGRTAINNAKIAYREYLDVFNSERFKALERKGARRQRPLWASTSTKNPAYSDVLYVDSLIAVGSVNTVPPDTILAFKDHGKPEATIQEDLPLALEEMGMLKDLGIDFEEVTAKLEADGVQKFADAYLSLLGSIDKRRTAYLQELGDLQKPVAEYIKYAEENRLVQRIYAHDPGVWSKDLAAQKEIRGRLGWLGLPESQIHLIKDLEEFLAQCLHAGFKNALILGMGGSSLAPEVLSLTLAKTVGKAQGLNLQILDSTDPEQIRILQSKLPIAQTLFIVSSKSGTTSETLAAFNYFWQEVQEVCGERAGEHFIAITDKGTPLEQLAYERGFRAVFNPNSEVGGRYSVFTMFGLVPAALMGIDLRKMLQKAMEISAECKPDIPAGRNPGLVLGAILGQAALAGRDKLTLLADPALAPLSAWLEQLIAESSGKDGKGILPVVDEPLLVSQDYAEDRLFVYLRLDGSQDKLAADLMNKSIPLITLNLNEVYDLSKEFYRWEFATAVACAVIGVNAFDQPDVQDNKTRTKQKIKEYKISGKLDEGIPIWENEEVTIYGTSIQGLDDCKNVSDVLRLYLQTLKPSQYVAINAYLPRVPEMIEELTALRKTILNETGLATTLGFGPRFLHSTGQFHKGGSNKGFFIQITRDPKVDITIPAEEISFATLQRAQALGDLEALLSRKRSAIRLHLKRGGVADLI